VLSFDREGDWFAAVAAMVECGTVGTGQEIQIVIEYIVKNFGRGGE
jgi:hypothetical protein